MARRAIAPLAPGVTLQPGYVVRVTALNPTTGALVAGVTVSDVRMQAETVSSPAAEPEPEKFVPLFSYS
jgi:hypothetical protein